MDGLTPQSAAPTAPLQGSLEPLSRLRRQLPCEGSLITSPLGEVDFAAGKRRRGCRTRFNPSVTFGDSPVCGARWMSSATARLRPPPTAAHTAPALASATGGGQARGPYRGAWGRADTRSAPTGAMGGGRGIWHSAFGIRHLYDILWLFLFFLPQMLCFDILFAKCVVLWGYSA